MLIRLIIFIIVLLVNLFFFKKIEETSLISGVSWTVSKALPYFLLIVIGVVFGYLLFKKSKWSKLLTGILQVVTIVLPFGLGFVLHPIYDGDFSKQGSIPKLEKKLPDFQNSDLIVLTIPGCPFCHESVNSSNFMVKRNPALKIKYIVCNSDPKEIEPYRIKLDKKIKVVLASSPDELGKVAQGRFPTFVQLKGDKAVQMWSNDQFGVRAKDLLESEK